MSDSVADLARLFPAARRVQAGGGEVEVLPVTLGAIAGLVALMEEGGALALANPVQTLIHQPALAARLIGALVARPAEWVEGLPADEAAALFLAGIEVNEPFFTRIAPALDAAGARLGRPDGG